LTDQTASTPPQIKVISIAHVAHHNIVETEFTTHTIAKPSKPCVSERDETYAFTKTNATSLAFAALTPSSKLFDSDDVSVAEEPTKDVIAVIGGMINWREFDPEPHLSETTINIMPKCKKEKSSPDGHCAIITFI
jgi:hypothetical protein